MPPKSIEFYFDCSSPWTYLAFIRVLDVVTRQNAEIVWKPILVGGVFNAVNESVYEARSNPHPVKGRYYLKDMRDWARHTGIEIGSPPVFPVNSVRAMRGALYALDEDKLYPYCKGLFEQYWGALRDISQWDVIREVAEAVGLDADALQAYAESQPAKDRLKVNTQELIDRGGFGSPTMFVGEGDMYFGNDRLELVEAALKRLG